MTTIRQRSEDFLKRNLEYEDMLRGTSFFPEGYTSTLGKKAGPTNLLEQVGDFLGVYKPALSEEDLLQQRQSNYDLLKQAADALVADQSETKKTETKEEDQDVFDTTLGRDREVALQNLDLYKDLLGTASDLSVKQSVQQAQALLPIIDQASARGLSRNLAASKDFLAFKQQQPLAQQAIMASKQQQMTGAADAFLKEAMAIATQQQAANQFGSLGTGRRFG
jgi:hypothetical protein